MPAINGRYAYRSVDGGGFGLWWVGGAWFVGEESDIGKRSGFLMAEDGSYLPESAIGLLEGALWWGVAGCPCCAGDCSAQ